MIGERIKAIRKEARLNQEEFANSLQVTQAAISYIEKNEGGISIELLEKISNTYKVSLDWIVKGEKSNGPKVYIEQTIEDLQSQINEIKKILLKNTNAKLPVMQIKSNSEKQMPLHKK